MSDEEPEFNEAIDFDDNCIYCIWYELCRGKYKNNKVKTYLENSDSKLKREIFFEFLFINGEIDNIFKLTNVFIEDKIDFRMLKFRKDMYEWFAKRIGS